MGNKIFRCLISCALVLGMFFSSTISSLAIEPMESDHYVGEPSPQIYGFVERMYECFLGRPSDPEGKEGWAAKLASGEIDGASFVYGFAHSPEFTDIYNSISNEDFVTLLYRSFLDREPDEAGFSEWVKYATNWMPLDWMIAGFVNSQEFSNLCEASGISRGNYSCPNVKISRLDGAAVGNFVERFYVEALGRSAEPEGKRHWATKIAIGEIAPADLVYSFLESLEFHNREGGLSNTEYVDCMYHTFFNRNPDEEGLSYWVSALDSGEKSRHDIIDGFVGSQEYINMIWKFFYPDSDDDGIPDLDDPLLERLLKKGYLAYHFGYYEGGLGGKVVATDQDKAWGFEVGSVIPDLSLGELRERYTNLDENDRDESGKNALDRWLISVGEPLYVTSAENHLPYTEDMVNAELPVFIYLQYFVDPDTNEFWYTAHVSPYTYYRTEHFVSPYYGMTDIWNRAAFNRISETDIYGNESAFNGLITINRDEIAEIIRNDDYTSRRRGELTWLTDFYDFTVGNVTDRW